MGNPSNTTNPNDTVLMSTPAKGVALLTLNRPDRMNAWNADLSSRYFALLEQCAADDDIRAIVVTGAGRGFCAGADMDALQSIGGSSGNQSGGAPSAEAASGSQLQSFTTTVPKPVIAAVNGACAGIGMVQALACDIRFAAAGAKFTTAFGRRGLIAEYGMSWLLPRLVGTANAMDLLLSARVVLAEEAHAMGMVNAVLPADQLVDHAVNYAADLAQNVSPTSMAETKRLVYEGAGQEMAKAFLDADETTWRLMDGPDVAEGAASFVERRPPNFPRIGQQGGH